MSIFIDLVLLLFGRGELRRLTVQLWFSLLIDRIIVPFLFFIYFYFYFLTSLFLILNCYCLYWWICAQEKAAEVCEGIESGKRASESVLSTHEYSIKVSSISCYRWTLAAMRGRTWSYGELRSFRSCTKICRARLRGWCFSTTAVHSNNR